MANPFLHYYQAQAQGKLEVSLQFGGNIPVFQGRVYRKPQNGRGFGSFFAKLFRIASPFLKTAGKHILHSGLNFGEDLLNGRTTFKEGGLETLKTIGKDVAGMAINDIRRQTGSGRKRKRSTSRKPVPRKKPRVRSTSRKTVPRKKPRVRQAKKSIKGKKGIKKTASKRKPQKRTRAKRKLTVLPYSKLF